MQYIQLVNPFKAKVSTPLKHKIMNINKFTIKSQEAIQIATAGSRLWTATNREHILRPYLKSMKM
jgi:hypothetical protein